MPPGFETALPFIIVALVVLLLVIWWVARSRRTTNIVEDESSGGDVLDEGAPRAKRNQALIDGHESMEHSFGDTSAAANTRKVAHASETADAEAGASVAPSTTTRPVTDPAQATSAPPSAGPQPARAGPGKEPGAHPPAAQMGDGATDAGDHLTRIKGLGPKLAAQLQARGITTFAQIASWSEQDIDEIDASLGKFAGRIRRDKWVEQAQLLKSGDAQAHAERFGGSR
ncbi:hypothetical protein [Erythrobacter sp.]|jgi:predicted flap endonuclease-1-like 5' DNA nuclease|uniref:hypothetical protein n=1 Tax=Erythrobacter sp. TaxID=1042 RepID=UPI002EAA6653|nr:hypothetical protein [Erythrobacter sp.]